jgi:hypothetical protein
MAIGLRQRDPAGNILVDITTRLTRVMGTVQIAAGSNGSVVVPQSGSNPIFYYFSSLSSSEDGSANPVITVSGDTISWNYPGRYNMPGVLTYGRF